MGFSSEVMTELGCRVQVVLPHLNERQRRLMLAQEARLLGHGGVRAVARVAGSARLRFAAACSSWKLAWGSKKRMWL
jgi:hypothetical protein